MILIHLVSTNQHDRGAEAAMTGFFFSGPLVALVAVIVWFVLRLLRRWPAPYPAASITRPMPL